MSTTMVTGPAESEPWASMLDQDDPTLSDLATGADELAIPLQACRDVLDIIADGTIKDAASLGVALVALVDKANSKRRRLTEHLYRLAADERPTEGGHGSQDQT